MIDFFRELGAFERWCIAVFLVLYAAYTVRIVLLTRKAGQSFRRILYKFLLRSFYFFLLIIALLGPSFGKIKTDASTASRDIYFVLDISKSMDAADIVPSRIEKAKFEIVDLCKSLPGDRVGLIIFSSDAFVQCPLTQDRDAFNLFVESVNTNLIKPSGTDIASGLQLAAKKHAETPPATKAVVLISDGEDFGTEAYEAARALRSEKADLYVIGVGSETQGLVSSGRNAQKTDQVKATELRSEELKELAEAARGRYFQLDDSFDRPSMLAEAIESKTARIRDLSALDISANKYYYFLTAALVLICLDALFTVRIIRLN